MAHGNQIILAKIYLLVGALLNLPDKKLESLVGYDDSKVCRREKQRKSLLCNITVLVLQNLSNGSH